MVPNGNDIPVTLDFGMLNVNKLSKNTALFAENTQSA